jgi:hypothetical protein
MASTPVEFELDPGWTSLIAKIFPLGSDTQANTVSGPTPAVEQTNRKGRYRILVTEALGPGWYVIQAYVGTVKVGDGYVYLIDDTTLCNVVNDMPNSARSIDGMTPEQALMYIGAETSGLRTVNTDTGEEVVKGFDKTTTRVTGTADEDGNRTAVNYV